MHLLGVKQFLKRRGMSRPAHDSWRRLIGSETGDDGVVNLECMTVGRRLQRDRVVRCRAPER